MKSSSEELELIRLYLDSQATTEQIQLLEQKMLNDDQLRKDFLAYARVDAALPYTLNNKQNENLEINQKSIFFHWSSWVSIAAVLVFLFTVNTGLFNSTSTSKKPNLQTIAQLGKLENCRWMDPNQHVSTGGTLQANDRIELSSGSADIHFKTGAIIQLNGPAIIELNTANSAFLTLGRAAVIADTEDSQGFSLKTPSSTFVDLGTAFTAAVAPDGLSRLDVTQGEVNLIAEHGHTPRLIKAGETMFVEPGKQKILTRMESGNESKSFIFPTIQPPSHNDYADASRGNAKVIVGKGILRKQSNWEVNPLSLLDGKGQSEPDSPQESVFLEKDNKGKFGNLLIDLGKAINIDKINSYSWHQHQLIKKANNRATQKFTIYGLGNEELPDLSIPLSNTGWKRIARVNSDSFFDVKDYIDRPAQQACSIFASKGKIGYFRYLLIEVHGPTFFGEIDVFGDQ